MRSKVWMGCLLPALVAALIPVSVSADAFMDYTPTGSFNLPASGVFDVLSDGRILSLDGADVYTETALGSRTFDYVGTLPDADMPNPLYAGPAFVRVSPDGSQIAVGNNGGSDWSSFEVGIFDPINLMGDWYTVSHTDASWIDSRHLAMTTGGPTGPPSIVTALDTLSPTSSMINPTLVDNIGGYSGGIAFDDAGNLYTGNGFVAGGPSDTGHVKAFPSSSWSPAMSGGAVVNFETTGTLIVDMLSAASLGFDAEGNLHVGGGDAYGSGDADYAGLVNSTAVADALAGNGAADPFNPLDVRKFDPDPSTGSFYDVNFNDITGELYIHQGSTVYTYVVPEPATAILLGIGGLVALRRRRSAH